ncbi:osmosensitive K+ channel histidine kinase [Beggiatoa alba B18LD]|uniref:histidine kinase n=1 Tax=Beggiatoa alba B18LD TaxID=395493 RepID=I3CE77_9GAMM|nr:ATP-binding protein [Beggiatoa alba]EIJ41920.1 osmosensitive K+ channel histidine kinase [Beggiatoa alba B18LD]
MSPTPIEQRPDPDILLAQIQQAEQKNVRGKLRIYFGSSAGVGKTFAMLEAAHKAQQAGRALLVGWIETHGRRETEALVQQLPVLDRKICSYHNKQIAVFDLDEALARKPALLLVDELAATNIGGARHPKRWQDVEELLANGIDIWTTLNVQHLESLNDVVSGITGIQVQETVPDTVFYQADEVVLVDVPVEELLNRLQAGKVYLPQQAQRAVKHFFRKGNLIALRELALRRTADRIEKDVQHYKQNEAIHAVWKTEGAILTCINDNLPLAEQVIRRTARLATQMSINWHVLYVETPVLQRLPTVKRERILTALKLAEALGATTSILTSENVAQQIVEYAHQHNLATIVMGHLPKTLQRFWQPSLSAQITQLSPDLDLLHVGFATTTIRAVPESPHSVHASATLTRQVKVEKIPVLLAILISLLTTAITVNLLNFFHLDAVNLVMLHLLAVVLVATKLGRIPAIIATLCNVAAFDFFLVSPRFSFAVSDVQFLLTFVVMLLVGLIISELTAGLRFQARIAAHREKRAYILFELARDLSGALKTEQIIDISLAILKKTFGGQVVLLLPDPNETLILPNEATEIQGLDIGIAQWAFKHNQTAGFATNTLPANPFRYLPLRAPVRIRGILAIQPAQAHWLLIPEQLRQLETCASVIAIALERVHFLEVAQDMLVHIESERLRNSLLSALSHDLRTPLTALLGLAESLTRHPEHLTNTQQELVAAIHQTSLRMTNMVNNLLDMARIEAGRITLQREPQVLEEIIGSAIRAVRVLLNKRRICISLPSDLPLLTCDAVLIERVFINLLENAAKYTPETAQIDITAQANYHQMQIEIADNGTGLPTEHSETLFEKFTRGFNESATSGIGLGLSICRAIINAHHGTITAHNRQPHGAVFCITLPLTPLDMPHEPDDFID